MDTIDTSVKNTEFLEERKIDTRINNIVQKTTQKDITESVSFKLDVNVNSLSLRGEIVKMINFITNTNLDYGSKIKIGDFLCTKLYNMYYLSSEKEKTIIKELTHVIKNAEELIIPLRLYFLRFLNTKVTYSICVNLFQEGIREKIKVNQYFQILKYILRPYVELYRSDIANNVVEESEAIFSNPETSLYTKMEIADIFLLNGKEERGRQMIEEIRELEREEQERRERERQERWDRDYDNFHRKPRKPKTVYNDTQNVHNEDINNSVLQVALKLIQLYTPNGIILEDVSDILFTYVSSEDRVHISTVLERIQIDTAIFEYNYVKFGLYDVFASLWGYIQNQSSKEDLLKRLVEEMISMSSYCSTGHLSRFVNVIQGFTDDKELQIRISNFEQIKSVVFHFLDNVLMNAPDNITDSMIDEDKSIFYLFVRDNMNQRIPSILKEYGEDTMKDIVESVKKYTTYQSWYCENNQIEVSLLQT